MTVLLINLTRYVSLLESIEEGQFMAMILLSLTSGKIFLWPVFVVAFVKRPMQCFH